MKTEVVRHVMSFDKMSNRQQLVPPLALTATANELIKVIEASIDCAKSACMNANYFAVHEQTEVLAHCAGNCGSRCARRCRSILHRNFVEEMAGPVDRFWPATLQRLAAVRGRSVVSRRQLSIRTAIAIF